ncbi:MAG: alkaline phosphatase family protein [Ilumatobacteraceae bacterium]
MGHTLLFAGKPKFDMMDREWSQFGAPDTVGADNGTDKIDYYQRLDPALAVDVLFQQMNADPDLQYMFFHIRTPDEIGHLFGWATADYRNAATTADTILGRILDGIDANPAWASSTAVIVVADHGGPTLEFFHSDHTIREDYTIPFVVYGPGVAWGTDLYQLNPDDRAWPFTNRPPATGVQPIREHEVANLALDLLGYPSVPGSVFNLAQDLNVS